MILQKNPNLPNMQTVCPYATDYQASLYLTFEILSEFKSKYIQTIANQILEHMRSQQVKNNVGKKKSQSWMDKYMFKLGSYQDQSGRMVTHCPRFGQVHCWFTVILVRVQALINIFHPHSISQSCEMTNLLSETFLERQNLKMTQNPDQTSWAKNR